MRLRLILAFILVVLVSIGSMMLVMRQNAAHEVNAYMFGGGMAGFESLVSELEDHYRLHDSWEGVESLLGSGMGHGMGRGGMGGQGMMGQRLRIYDSRRLLVADSAGATGDAAPLDDADYSRAIALDVNGHTVGYLLTEGGMGFARGDEVLLINRLNRAGGIAALVAGGIALVLAFLLALGLSRPVGELTRAARQMARGDLRARVPARGPGELASLGAAFNQMAASLQRAEETRRAMTADIAHELRNPLAVQRASLEALQDGVYPLTADNLQPLLEQNQLLTHLVDDLRTLALADAGQLALERTPADFPALVQRILDRFAPQAAQQNITLSFSSPPASFPAVSLDPIRIEQVLNNLLSNALRHTPRGGTIECGVSVGTPSPSTLPGLLLTVHDSGPGISTDDLPLIFDRFYRADKSRSRAEGGTGLGLAIARQLAEAHGGTLTAANHPQGGAVFALTLPLG